MFAKGDNLVVVARQMEWNKRTSEHFVKCKEASDKSNIISLKGLPPPPPKPPRIFLDGKSNSNVVTLENVVATNYK